MELLNIVKFKGLNIVWMPGETFAQYSILLRRIMGNNTLFLGVTNGITGYIAPPDETEGYLGEGFYL